MISFTIILVALQTVVAAPAPPPPPKRGTFSCIVRDRDDHEFELSGAMIDWRKVDGVETAAFDIVVPRKAELGGRYRATFRGSQITIAKATSSGSWLAGGVLEAGFRPEGMIMLSQGSSSYVGFCDVRFSTG